MGGLTKKRVTFAVGGFVYGLALAVWGAMISGGGHFNLPFMLAVSPAWMGILLWPLWGFLSARFDSQLVKALFLVTMAAHYAGLYFYVRAADNSDDYWFRIGMHDPAFIWFPASAFALYLAGQLFLWLRFLRDSFGRRRELSSGAR
jgi:hypothetical protein